MQGQISIPPIPEFRAHIIAVTSLLEGYMLTVAADLLPADTPLARGVHSMVSREEVHALKEKLIAAPEKEKLEMTQAEGVLLYACYVLLSRLLVSAEGEAFCEQIYTLWPTEDEADAQLKDFPTFRNMLLTANDHLIADADQMIGEAEGFAEMKARLNALEG